MADVEMKDVVEERVQVTEKMTDYKATSIALIEKLLQFSTPRLDGKIVNVLFLEGMMELLMTHITRLDSTQESIELNKCSLESKLKHALHTRDTENVEALKRSYHAMEILSGTTANHLWIQNAKFHTIVNHLFDLFLPNSQGNFNHFYRIFQHFIRRYPCDMLEFVILSNDATILFDSMLPYLTESPVMDSILSLIFIRDINPETKGQREKCHDKLHQLKFLEWIIQAIQMTNHPKFVEACQEFFIRIIEESSQVENGDILLKALDADMIQVLVKQIVDNPPCKIRKQTIHIVKLLVKSGILNSRASSTPVQGPLYLVSIRSQELLSNYLSQLSLLIINDRGQTCNTKEYPLTTSDIDLLEIVYQILFNRNEKSQMLASIHADFWEILVNSFFEKSSSNIYHTLFYRMFSLILTSNDELTITAIISKPCLIQRLIQEYQDKSKRTDIRGYALLMLNHLRLMTDSQQSKMLTQMIMHHTGYQQFLPTLRNDTLTQLQHIYSWKLDACPRPPAHVGPSPPIQVTHFSPYAGTIPLITNINDTEHDGIDLGSEFAYSLGFNSTGIEREEGFETPSEYLSRRNSDQSLSSSQSESGPPVDILFESLTSEEPVTTSLKKKKKKKKSKKHK